MKRVVSVILFLLSINAHASLRTGSYSSKMQVNTARDNRLLMVKDKRKATDNPKIQTPLIIPRAGAETSKSKTVNKGKVLPRSSETNNTQPSSSLYKNTKQSQNVDTSDLQNIVERRTQGNTNTSGIRYR